MSPLSGACGLSSNAEPFLLCMSTSSGILQLGGGKIPLSGKGGCLFGWAAIMM